MKKTFISLTLSLCVLAAASAFDATVVSAKGKAEVLKGGTWTALAAGNTVSKGDVIQTGFKSEVVLKLKETTVTVSPLTRITMEQLAEKKDKDDSKIFLDTGSLKSDIKKSENRRVGFQVRSPVATASVRGTVIAAAVTFDGMNLDTYYGTAAIWKTNGATATLTTEEEDKAEPPAAMEGSSAQAITDDGAPKGAVTVSGGQSAEITATAATVSTPQQKAAENATSLEGSTVLAAAMETNAMAGTAPAVASTISTDTAGATAANQASLMVEIIIGE